MGLALLIPLLNGISHIFGVSAEIQVEFVNENGVATDQHKCREVVKNVFGSLTLV